jgi:hypothetical protein
MTPLLFAAALVVSPASAQPTQALESRFQFGEPSVRAATCAKRAIQTLGRNGFAPITKLGDLPPGVLEHAVLRIVDGCPVREIVYAGQTYYYPDIGSDGLERLDPAVPSTKER